MKTLCVGAGLALAAGLLTGAAMKPQLITDGQPAGPQMPAGRSGARAVRLADDATSYAGQIPAYVAGTDATGTDVQTAAPPAVPAAASATENAAETYYVSPLGQETSEPPVDPRAATPMGHDAPAVEHLAYPSRDGGEAYDAAARVQTADIGGEAPPDVADDAR